MVTKTRHQWWNGQTFPTGDQYSVKERGGWRTEVVIVWGDTGHNWANGDDDDTAFWGITVRRALQGLRPRPHRARCSAVQHTHTHVEKKEENSPFLDSDALCVNILTDNSGFHDVTLRGAAQRAANALCVGEGWGCAKGRRVRPSDGRCETKMVIVQTHDMLHVQEFRNVLCPKLETSKLAFQVGKWSWWWNQRAWSNLLSLMKTQEDFQFEVPDFYLLFVCWILGWVPERGSWCTCGSIVLRSDITVNVLLNDVTSVFFEVTSRQWEWVHVHPDVTALPVWHSLSLLKNGRPGFFSRISQTLQETTKAVLAFFQYGQECRFHCLGEKENLLVCGQMCEPCSLFQLGLLRNPNKSHCNNRAIMQSDRYNVSTKKAQKVELSGEGKTSGLAGHPAECCGPTWVFRLGQNPGVPSTVCSACGLRAALTSETRSNWHNIWGISALLCLLWFPT